MISPFNEEYHSYIRTEMVKGRVEGYRIKRHTGYRKRDLMVEGSGLLQWLSVYALAFSHDIDTILLDEPDAHLHPSLQTRLLENLQEELGEKQVLVVTHSADILKKFDASSILEIKDSQTNRYLIDDSQKVALLEGIGTNYSPNFERAQETKHVLFVENKSDASILNVFAKKLEIDFPGRWIVWPYVSGHKERKSLFLGLQNQIHGLKAMSLRDRDGRASTQINVELNDVGDEKDEDFRKITWKRKMIENYLIDPFSLAQASEKDVSEIDEVLRESFALSIGDSFPMHNAPDAILDADGKKILKGLGLRHFAVAEAMPISRIPDDIRKIFAILEL